MNLHKSHTLFYTIFIYFTDFNFFFLKYTKLFSIFICIQSCIVVQL